MRSCSEHARAEASLEENLLNPQESLLGQKKEKSALYEPSRIQEQSRYRVALAGAQSTRWASALSDCQRPPTQTKGAGLLETERSNLWLHRNSPAWGLKR